LCPGIACGYPSEYLPILGPRSIAPTRPAHAPTERTIEEPAKSTKPNESSQPPFHFQLPAIGYINAVNTTAKTTNSPNLTLSATRPETIVAAVPANADWNKKSTVGTNQASVTISAVTVGSKNKPPK